MAEDQGSFKKAKLSKNPFMKMMTKEKKESSKMEKSEKYTKSKASKMDKMIDKKLVGVAKDSTSKARLGKKKK